MSVTIKSKQADISKVLIFSTTLVLLSKNDTLDFKIVEEKIKTTIRIKFISDDSKDELFSFTHTNIEDNILEISLNKWESTSPWLEVNTPLEFMTKSGYKFWVKYRSQAEAKFDHRIFHISIWGEDK